METKSTSTLEVTQTEWDTRKLSKYGYFSGIFDIVYIVLTFVAMGSIATDVIPRFLADPGITFFWQVFITILFINGLRTLARVLNPLSSYQTIIIRN
jgi:hypothetical protein